MIFGGIWLINLPWLVISQVLLKIIGDYKPGYLYGTVKIHKPNHPLRPIIMLYCHNHNIDLRTSINERTHFFIKICISYTLFSMFLWCVRDEWRHGQTAILTQLIFLTITALLPHLRRGCSTGGHWGPQPSVRKLDLTLAFLCPTNSTAAGTCLYSFITHSCFRFFSHLFTQVHLWLTARSRVNIQQYHKYLNRFMNSQKQ